MLIGSAGAARAQLLHGVAIDSASQAPVANALVQLFDSSGHSLTRSLTSPTGRFTLQALGTGQYTVRIAAIGYRPATTTIAARTTGAVPIPAIMLATAPQVLPDLIARAKREGCELPGPANSVFARVIDGAATAFGVIDATLRSGAVRFETRVINRRIVEWPARSLIADTTTGQLSDWPVQTVDPDTLRLAGFGRQLGTSTGRVYYGPDDRVLFSNWFVDSHCFKLVHPEAGGDSLRVTFSPRKKGDMIDISGELVLDIRTLVPYRLTYRHENLPTWMPKGVAGGEVEFLQLGPQFWVTSHWKMYAPIPTPSGTTGRLIAGRAERIGRVVRLESQSRGTPGEQ